MMNNMFELMIRRSHNATPPTPSIPTDYVFYAPLATDFDDHSISARTCTEVGDDTANISLETKDGMASAYIPMYAKLTYPIGDVVVADNARTFSIWYYPTFDDNGYLPIFGVGGESTSELFEIALNNYNVSFGGRYDDVFSDSQVHEGWNHMAVTFDGTTIKVYHDGVFVASGDLELDTVTSNIVISGRPWEEWAWNQGWYADAYIYNRELSSAEIQMLYNAHGDSSDSSSSGSDISDSSSSGSDISDSSSSGGGDPTLVWYTPFTTDYTETVGNVTGVPTSSGICEIVSDSRFGGYLDMHKYSGGNLTGLQYPNTQNALQLGTGNWSMSFWLNAPQWNDYGQAIISHRGNGTGFDSKDGFVLFKDSSTYMDMRIGANYNQATSSAIPTDDTWHNWAFIHYSDGEWEWYMDGEYVEGGSGWGGDATSNGNVNVFVGGDGDWGKSAVFKLCHLRIYNRYLEYEEIEDMYHEFDESSDSSSSMSDSSSSISDLIFHAPFTTDLSEIVGNRTATPTDSGAANVTITTKDGKSCVYVPNNARLLYSPCGDVPLGNTAKSMAIWVNLNFANSRWNGFLGVGENSQYKLFLLASNNSWQVAYGGSYNDIDTDTSQLHSGWNHVAVTYDTTAIRLYHDGVLVKTSVQSNRVNTAETSICVGGRPAASDNYCESAWFSDARIYSRALTDAEILSIYQEGL